MPLIRSFVPEIEGVEVQNFGLEIAPDGRLYVANLGGLLIFDGAWWQRVEVGLAESVLALAAGPDGEIVVGGVDELGLVRLKAEGRPLYTSLTPRLATEPRTLGPLLGVHAVGGHAYFLFERALLDWDGERFHRLSSFEEGAPVARSFLVRGVLYVWSRRGLERLEGGRLVPVPGGAQLAGRKLEVLLPADQGRLLAVVRETGLLLLDEVGELTPFAPAASAWLKEHRATDGERLADGRWAIGSVNGGLLLLGRDGTVEQVIDARSGLPEDYVTGLAEDGEGGLWVSLNSDLVRLEIASPLSVFDRRLGVPGDVYALERHRGRLWVGTVAGLAVTPEPGREATRTALGTRLAAVPGVEDSVWSLLSAGEDLLIGTSNGVFALPPGGPLAEVSGLEARTGYLLARKLGDPRRAWVGTDRGLVLLRRADGRWEVELTVAGLEGEVRSLAETAETLWCGLEPTGIVGLGLPLTVEGVEAERVPTARASGAPRWVESSAKGTLARFQESLLVVQEDRVSRLDEATARLVREPRFARLGAHGELYQLLEDARGNVWLNTTPPVVARPTVGPEAWQLRPLVEVPARSTDVFLAEPDGTVWLGSDAGLFRFAGAEPGRQRSLAAPQLVGVKTVEGRALRSGSFGQGSETLVLPPDMGRLRLSFSPRSFQPGLRFETRLDPVDKRWGAPSAEPAVELTRLPPGEYQLLVRSVAPGGETSPETAWRLRVEPPWYQSPPALALWTVTGLALLFAYGRLRSRTVRQRATELEERVSRQTWELRETVATLRHTQTELEAANARLEQLSLLDELTGIPNRRRLQLALDVEWQRALDEQQPLAFVFADLDHFKLLNDTGGHREGDRCLQTVARFLASGVRRPRDLVVRYGGEEFGILLPGTTLPAAIGVAERLRAGLQALGIRHPGTALGVVTASFGVSVGTPQPGQRPEVLIEAADFALYAAKTEGRNRVRSDEDALALGEATEVRPGRR